MVEVKMVDSEMKAICEICFKNHRYIVQAEDCERKHEERKDFHWAQHQYRLSRIPLDEAAKAKGQQRLI